MDAVDVIKALGLSPLPSEGGYFRETYRSQERIPTGLGSRTISTAIYFLMTQEEFSVLHRFNADEVYHFYLGDPVQMVKISPTGESQEIRLGSDLAQGQVPQVVVPSGYWQGSKVIRGGEWALLGCTVAPGFEFGELEVGHRGDLLATFPALSRQIEAFTRR